jgi:MYXO-CTERM domain-containing protein
MYLGFESGTQVVLDIESTPAPGAIALLGMAGLAGRRRRHA